MFKRSALSVIGLSAICLSVFVLAQDKKTPVLPPLVPKPDLAQTSQSKTQKQLQAVYESFQQDESTYTSFMKKATITDVEEGTVFKADEIKVKNRPAKEKPAPGDKEENQVATATGNMSVVDKQAEITGERCVTYFAKSKRLAVVTGNVVIIVKPKSSKPDAVIPAAPAPVIVNQANGKATLQDPQTPTDEGPSSARKYPATITCDKLEYEYAKDKKHALLTGNFKVVQMLSDKTRTMTAEHAEWFGLEEKVVLYPPVHVEDTKGMLADSKEIVVVMTKEGAEGLTMKKGMATINVDDEDAPAAQPVKPSPIPDGKKTEPANPVNNPIKKP